MTNYDTFLLTCPNCKTRFLESPNKSDAVKLIRKLNDSDIFPISSNDVRCPECDAQWNKLRETSPMSEYEEETYMDPSNPYYIQIILLEEDPEKYFGGADEFFEADGKTIFNIKDPELISQYGNIDGQLRIDEWNDNITATKRELILRSYREYCESYEKTIYRLLEEKVEEQNSIIEKLSVEKNKALDSLKNNSNCSRTPAEYKVIMIDKEKSNVFDLIRKAIKQRKDIVSQNIIHPKYMNYIAITTMYEYFVTGRVSELKGATGAYNLYESELRQNLIIDKLDTIEDKLDTIIENQNVLYNEISGINFSIDKMSLLSSVASGKSIVRQEFLL